MKNIILTSKSKKIVDILLIILLPLTWISGETGIISEAYWCSFHCIIGMLWVLLITPHIIQHWKFIKALPKKKVFTKNKIIVLTTIAFIIIIISILTLINPVDQSLLDHHHRIGKLFCIIIIIHILQKWKRFTTLFHLNTKKKEGNKTTRLNPKGYFAKSSFFVPRKSIYQNSLVLFILLPLRGVYQSKKEKIFKRWS